MNFLQLTTFSAGLIFFSLFCISLIIQLWFYLNLFSRLAFHKKTATLNNHRPPVSVIICAKNELKNLSQNLSSIFEQDYPEYQVVVVNDCSNDDTGDYLKGLMDVYPTLKVITIIEDEYYTHGKKIALMMGIKGAAHEYLLLTDADCKPKDKYWLRNMISEFNPETEIILGYGAYEKQPTFLNKIIRFDTFVIGLQYLSFALANKSYMGTGRNLAYKKSLFFKMKGFASHYHIESGDDDLFVNEAVSKQHAKIKVNLNDHTVSKVKTTLKDWMTQKCRHLTTYKLYDSKSKFRLVMISVSQHLFFITFIILLICKVALVLIIFLFTLRLLIQMIIFKKSMLRLGEKDLFVYAPILELVLLFMYPLIIVSNKFLKKNKWK
jgi:cellulose synthase/poly-beta-1,6-N-acetylglucosamine synthase-like glycosyltransferase